MCRTCHSALVAGALALGTAGQAASQAACRPKLSITGAQFSEMIPPTLERKWTAFVAVDASACSANASGSFELGLTRLKENGYDVDFRERFAWRAPSVGISVDFSADEAVERYWIESVTPCRCAD
ncbi:MAG: hypothetical protein ACJ72H_11570 [Candidatus Sulfotelmatobacter sp.]